MYSQGVAQYLNLFADEPFDPAEAAFLRAALAPGSSVLDIGAGTGGLARALAAEGFKVTALEPDPEMYAAMLMQLSWRADLWGTFTPVPRPAGFDLGERFDACLCLAMFHHLLDAAERADLFQYARVHLRPGGCFLLDTPVDSPQRAEIPYQLKAQRQFGGTRYEHHYAIQRCAGGRWRTVWEFLTWRGEALLERCRREFEWTLGSLDEVAALARAAGLTLEETFADFDRSPFVAGASRLLVAVMRAPD
jgi:SAM-dependent methyltransferase